MNYSYIPESDPTVRLIRLLWWTLILLLIYFVLLTSGALATFEDGSFVLHLGGLDLSGCINPLALCAN